MIGIDPANRFEISLDEIEVLKRMAREKADQIFIDDHNELANKVNAYRTWEPTHKVGFVAGTWDMLHIGHLDYIEIARMCVDLLIVGVDIDELARSRKSTDGINRPVVLYDERRKMLRHIRNVDIITPVVDDMLPILQLIKPDILVLSSTTNDLPKEEDPKYIKYQDHSRCILMLPPQAPPEEASTTARIRNLLRQGLNHAEANLKKTVERAISDKFEDLRSKL